MGFLYQFFDLTNDYLKYDHVNQLSVEYTEAVIPSVTICFKKEDLLSNDPGVKFINQTLNCLVDYLEDNDIDYCFKSNKFENKIRYKQGKICVTFFNKQEEIDYLKKINAWFIIFSTQYNRTKFIFHSQNDPPHFELHNFIFLEIHQQYIFTFKTSKRTLLPTPFESDCYDYSRNQQDDIWPISQLDCQLELMRQKELEICGNDYYWNQVLLDDSNGELVFKKNLKSVKLI